jgi:urease accessory protein
MAAPKDMAEWRGMAESGCMVESGGPAEPGGVVASGSMAEPHAYKLFAWLSPAMPVGAYSYSHALESAVEAGAVDDAPNLRRYVETVLRYGTGWTDGLLLRAAHEAGVDGAFEGWSLAEILTTAAAMRGTSELALESAAQGRALLTVLRTAWPAAELADLDHLCRQAELEPPYAAVLGLAARAHGLPLEAALPAFLQAFAANLISAGIRLIPLGQTDGQRLTAALEGVIAEVVALVMISGIEDLGSAALAIDLFSMAHETQYTRLFRS